MSRFKTYLQALQQTRFMLMLNLSTSEGMSEEEVAELAAELQEYFAENRVTGLSLRSNQISAQGMRALAPVLGKIKISYLDLVNNQIGTEGAKALAEALQENTSLAFSLYQLDLTNNNIGPEGLKAIINAWQPQPDRRFNRYATPDSANYSNTKMAVLNLDGNNIGNDLALFFAEKIRYLPIIKLSIQGEPLSLAVAKKFAEQLGQSGITEFRYDMDINGSEAVIVRDDIELALSKNNDSARELYDEIMKVIRGETHSLKRVKYFLNGKTKPLACVYKPSSHSDPLIHQALKAEKIELVRFMLECAARNNYLNILLDELDSDNQYPINIALRSNNPTIRRLFHLDVPAPNSSASISSSHTSRPMLFDIRSRLSALASRVRTSIAHTRLGASSDSERQPLNRPINSGSGSYPQ